MSTRVIVLYPNKDDGNFDLDYYLATHMPLVGDSWGPVGLKSWDILKFTEGLNGAKADYIIGAVLYWESEEKWKAAANGDKAGAVFGDIPNFTNTQPTLVLGDVQATKTL